MLSFHLPLILHVLLALQHQIDFQFFRFLFDNGSEQSGEYIIKEEVKEAEMEGEEALVIERPVWVASSIGELAKVEVNLETL